MNPRTPAAPRPCWTTLGRGGGGSPGPELTGSGQQGWRSQRPASALGPAPTGLHTPRLRPPVRTSSVETTKRTVAFTPESTQQSRKWHQQHKGEQDAFSASARRERQHQQAHSSCCSQQEHVGEAQAGFGKDHLPGPHPQVHSKQHRRVQDQHSPWSFSDWMLVYGQRGEAKENAKNAEDSQARGRQRGAAGAEQPPQRATSQGQRPPAKALSSSSTASEAQ